MDPAIPCLHCGSNIPNLDKYYFCPQCLGQVRCKNCDEILIKDATGCIHCGTPLLVKDNQKNEAINKIEFEQEGNNKKFTASFTNSVGENLVSSLSSLFIDTTQRTSQNPFDKGKTRHLPEGQRSDSTSTKEGKIEDIEFVDVDPEALNTSLTKIFRENNGKLILINSRLKHTGKRDQAIRIAILTLYAYSALKQNQIKKSELVSILTSAAVYDNNYLTWLSQCDEIRKVDSEYLELNLPGRDAAIQILREFNDQSIDKGTVVFSGTSSKGTRKTRDKKTKNSDNHNSSDPKLATKTSPRSSSKMTPTKMLDILIGENYFKQRKRVPEIVKHCKDIKAQTIENQPLSIALLRKVKNNILKREKNASDNQYEYYQ